MSGRGRRWPNRRTGTTWAGVAAGAVALLVLTSVSTGGVSRSTIVRTPPYLKTTTVPNVSTVASGCATVKATEAKWTPRTGQIHGLGAVTSKSCLPIGGGNAGGTSTATTGISIGIPFQVATNGAHSISSNWTLNLSSVRAHTVGHCPTSLVNPNQPLAGSDSSLCQDSAGYSFSLSATLMDVNNFPWYTFNTSAASFYDFAGWEDYRYCYNYGTPTCSNYTGPTGYSYSTGSNDPGSARFTFSGSSTITLWTNATGMVATHHYLLVVGLSISASDYAFMFHVKSVWKASASATISLAGPNNGATLNWIGVT